MKKSLNKSIIRFFIYFLNIGLFWSHVSNLEVALFNLESFVILVKVGVALFNLESFVFLIKVGVALFVLESKGPIYPLKYSFWIHSEFNNIFKFLFFKSSLLFSYLLGGFP